ncbi:MAG: ABC transporter substrate-binding protein [Clostridiaceae bacterium]|nr:ABC transporter substrate-binding protein [Clostridiaceae bacterium]
MKEKIYTIPVHDAYLSDAACPLCELERTTEQNLLSYYLGPAMMEPDVRVGTNEKGFCRDHWRRLYQAEENRLGLGLVLHTHVDDVHEELSKLLEDIVPNKRKGMFSGKDKTYKQKIEKTADKVSSRVGSCLICDRIAYTMDRYIEVIFYQFFQDPAFRQHFTSRKGYCLPHLAELLRSAADRLDQDEASQFLQVLVSQQNEAMAKLRTDVEWFTLKFDYRNATADWKDSKDALPRAIRNLTGCRDID